jgi:hypothetical protein
MDYRPPTSGDRPCQGDAANFAANYPSGAVQYEVGGTYTLAWPPKNHVAACGNANIPDTFLKLHMVQYDGQSDPNQSVFRENLVKTATFTNDPHVKGRVDYKGFQKCPNFCNNRDKALCTGDFTVPEATAPGKYTFQWYWAFNGPQDLYSTCYEAEIVAKGQGDGTGFDEVTSTSPSPTTAAPTQPGATQEPTSASPPNKTNPDDMNFRDIDLAMNRCAGLDLQTCNDDSECTWCSNKPRNVCGSNWTLSQSCQWTPSTGRLTYEDECDEPLPSGGIYKENYKIIYSSECPSQCNTLGDFGYMPCSSVLTYGLPGFMLLLLLTF